MAITLTTLNGAITNLDNTINLTSVTAIPASLSPQTGAGLIWIKIDNEYMLLLAPAVGNTLSVLRGYNASASQAHTNGSVVLIGSPSDYLQNNYWGLVAEFARLTTNRTIQEAINLSGTADIIDNTNAGFYEIKTAAVDAMTLAAPGAAAEGIEISIYSDTPFAHTLTATALLANGTALKTTATFAAFRGAGISLRATNGVYHVIASTGVTFT